MILVNYFVIYKLLTKLNEEDIYKAIYKRGR